MTVLRTIKCNFCGKRYTEDEIKRESFYGMYWTGANSKELETKNVYSTENHLCGTCLLAITKVGQKEL